MIAHPYKRTILLLLLLLLTEGKSYADSDAVVNGSISSVEQLSHLAQSYWQHNQFAIGLGAQQATLALSRVGQRASLTDNGSVTLLVSADTRGHPLLLTPLRDGGSLNLNYDFTGTANIVGLHKELIDSAVIGSNIGTGVHGGFAGAGARLNLSMGPLYHQSSIFWRYSLAAGPGLLYYKGTAQFYGNQASSTPANVGGHWQPMFWLENKWELLVNRWDLVFNTQYLVGPGQGYQTTYIVFGLGLAYRWSF